MTDADTAVFLWYASQDADGAKRICDALRTLRWSVEQLVDHEFPTAIDLLHFVAAVSVTAPEALGMEKPNVAPSPSFAVAHSCPL